MHTAIELDETDRAIRDRRLAAWDERPGPRVGDFVRYTDGTLRRFSHDWDEYGLQTCDSGRFYLGEGHMSFSGALYAAVPPDTLRRTDEILDGACWFFHHDMRRAGNGVDIAVACRVYACSLPVNHDAPRV